MLQTPKRVRINNYASTAPLIKSSAHGSFTNFIVFRLLDYGARTVKEKALKKKNNKKPSLAKAFSRLESAPSGGVSKSSLHTLSAFTAVHACNVIGKASPCSSGVHSLFCVLFFLKCIIQLEIESKCSGMSRSSPLASCTSTQAVNATWCTTLIAALESSSPRKSTD